MPPKKFYITTAIDYPNAKPHVGTSYEKIAADVVARYHRMLGDDVLFLMGNDEHSQKVEKAAREQNLSPIEYCDRLAEGFRETWGALSVSYDDFIRTSEKRHVETVERLMTAIHGNGDLYLEDYEGWYCAGCEAFKRPDDLQNGLCPLHPNRTPEWLKEKNWFFRLTKYRDALLRHFEANPGFVQPESRRNEMLALLHAGLADVSATRATEVWGIRVPFDPKAVVYVWFDALTNYVSGAGYSDDRERFARYWPADVHLIGKDISRFHTVIWPAMLLSAGIELPRSVWVHGFVNMGQARMSKSLGTTLDPLELVRTYGSDAVRFYLMSDAVFGRDLEFSLERLVLRSNVDLANGYGNLLSRTATMLAKYRDGKVPRPAGDSAVRGTIEDAVRDYHAAMEAFDLSNGVAAALSVVARANLLVEERAPWTLAKDPGKAALLDATLYDLVESLRTASILLHPFMPDRTREALARLGVARDVPASAAALAFGGTKPGTPVAEGDPLFPRIDKPAAS